MRRTPACLARKPLVVTLFSLFTGMAQAAPVLFDQPAQSLQGALTQFARAAGLELQIAPGLAAGKNAPALSGSMEPVDALQVLLADSDLRARVEGNSLVVTRAPQTGAATLGEVVVMASGHREGSAEVGYKPETAATTGPWGARPILDTPYTITVIPAEMIENTVARNTDQLFKMAPVVQASQPLDVNNIVVPSMRGFSVTRVYVNGVQNDNLGLGVFTEEMENLEILSGLSGFLYGASMVGGVVNYSIKRPTTVPRYKATVGNYGNEQYFAHADLGGPIGSEGKFGYRLNLMGQDGETNIKDQNLKRWLVSAAIDWRLTDRALIQFNAGKKEYDLTGRQTQFFFGNNPPPKPLDGTKLYGPSDTFNKIESTDLGLNLDYQINEAFRLRAGWQHAEHSRSTIYTTSAGLLNNNTQYQFNIFGNKSGRRSNGFYTYADGSFSTAGIRHKLTAGIYGYSFRGQSSIFADGSTVLRSPAYVIDFSDDSFGNISAPDWSLNDSRMVTTSRSSNRNLVIGDDIRFNDKWSMLVGLNRSTLVLNNYNAVSGERTQRYDKSATTPTLSVLYKPQPNITTYASYLESLEQGTIVGATYRNAGEILEPLVSEQYEIGIKANIGGVLLGGALFQIDKSNQYSDDGTSTGTFVQDGRQVHRGVELTVVGKITSDVTLSAGGTWLDARIKRSNNLSLEGKRATGVSEKMAKIYAEYDLPGASGLIITGGAYYTGERYSDGANQYKISAYTLVDVGARYQTKMLGHETSLRLNVTNATNKRYWAGSTPGIPRSLALSMSMVF